MKKLKTKILNVLLVSAIGTAALGGALLGGKSVKASALSAPSSVFTATSSASVKADVENATQTAFVFPDGGKVAYRRDLALKWFAKDDQDAVKANYLSLTFALKDANFETLTFTFETATATSSDEDKATNTIVFTSNGTSVTGQVNEGSAFDVALDEDITIALSQTSGAADGVYDVLVNGIAKGQFTNVGGNFADYKNNVLTPLSIVAKVPASDSIADGEVPSTTVLFKDLNGQSFELNDSGKIKEDTAAPVLVLNEELIDLTLGAKFDIDYTKIDVLDDSLQTTVEYYQYNPTHTEVNWVEMPDDAAFSDTVYENTTVLEKEGMEYIAIRIKMEDDAHKDDDAAVYEFAWYAEQTVSPVVTATTENATVSSLEYIRLAKNDLGPTLNASFDFEDYQDLVIARANIKSAGDSAKLNLPSVEGMFEDDDTGYKGFKYTVYYKSKSSPSGGSSSADYDSLTIPVEKEGEYEFKIVASDKSGNPMTAKDENNQVVDVTSSNVWELDSIPSFTFKIKSAELSIEENKLSLRSTTGIIDVQFSVDSFDVNGPSGYGEHYALFYFDIGAFQARFGVQIDETVLASVQYSDLVAPAFNPAEVDDVAELYALLYAELLLATDLDEFDGITPEELVEADEDGNVILRQIGEENNAYSDSVYPDNKYEWDATDKTFNPAEEGIYIVFGIFTHPEQASNTVGAYQVISVSATEDIIAGETQWLKNNLASVILFAIAAVLLVIIIILLLIKPSDETLEDVVKTKKKKEEKVE